MTRDIFEHLVEDYYVSRVGWFVKHNRKYRLLSNNSKGVGSFSDIDIIAINEKINGKKPDRVHVISCKSWQDGFGVNDWLEIFKGKKTSKGSANRKAFREVIIDKWIKAFLETLEQETKQRDFIYKIAVIKIKKRGYDKKDMICEIINKRFKKRNINMKMEFLTLDDIIKDMKERIEINKTKTIEPTDTGRIMQIFSSANILGEEYCFDMKKNKKK
jgi:hypothetical protein